MDNKKPIKMTKKPKVKPIQWVKRDGVHESKNGLFQIWQYPARILPYTIAIKHTGIQMPLRNYSTLSTAKRAAQSFINRLAKQIREGKI